MDYPTDKALSGAVDPNGIDSWWFRAIELQLAAAVSVAAPEKQKPPTLRSGASDQLFVRLPRRG